MKRILYISHFSCDWKSHEIQELANLAARNNQGLSVTGILITFERLFFQIIEGPETSIDCLFHKICQDSRHNEIAIIQTEENIGCRLFSDWHMRAFDLDRSPEALEYSVKILLKSLLGTYELIGKYNPPGILARIKAGINPSLITPARVTKIVMFADIVGFSRISEKFSAEKVFEIVTSFFEIVTSAIHNHGGEVEKFIGDCVMASFPENHSESAIKAGLEILRSTREIILPEDVCGSHDKFSCGIGFAIAA